MKLARIQDNFPVKSSHKTATSLTFKPGRAVFEHEGNRPLGLTCIDLADLVKLMIWDEQNIIRAGTTEPGTHDSEEAVVNDCGSGYIRTP